MKIVTSFSPVRIERQQYCLETWKKYGCVIEAVQTMNDDLDLLQRRFPGVQFIVSENDAGVCGRPKCPRIKDLVARATNDEILIVNSDISIKYDAREFRRQWCEHGESRFVCGIRFDRSPGGQKSLNRHGVDAFRFTPRQAESVPDLGMGIGSPMWDTWIVLHFWMAGYDIVAHHSPGLIHARHPIAWSRAELSDNKKLVADHYGIAAKHMARIVSDATGRGHAPHRMPRPHLNRNRIVDPRGRILIVGTPRVGSNMLLYSLASHPRAVNAGEVLCDDNPPEIEYGKRMYANYLETCNLFKLFWMYRESTEARLLLPTCPTIVFLYRKDIDAQIASWQRAAETGLWTAGHSRRKTNTPPNLRHFITEARRHLEPMSTLKFSYEQLCQDWDNCVSAVLNSAQWDDIPLRKATVKLSSATEDQEL